MIVIDTAGLFRSSRIRQENCTDLKSRPHRRERTRRLNTSARRDVWARFSSYKGLWAKVGLLGFLSASLPLRNRVQELGHALRRAVAGTS